MQIRSSRQRILVLYGTRPEAIKLAPVVEALQACPDDFAVTVCSAAQHREMLDQVQELFGLRPAVDLDLMRPSQGLNQLCARTFARLDEVLVSCAPDWVVVQGDTTTALVGALAAFQRRIKVAHVEAGLRTGDLQRPFPEEANRRVVDLLADALFAPTERARRSLLAEGAAENRIFVTGNTVIDSLHRIAVGIERPEPANEVLVTVHRRESFGRPLRRIFTALAELARRFPETRWVYPVHRNPMVWDPAHEILGAVPNVELHEPFDYLRLVRCLARVRLVLTDSGGLQEEAPAFGKPVLVLRDRTERPEGVEAGTARLVGTEADRIIAETARLLTDPEVHASMARAINPYGDGRAGERIARILAGREFQPFVPERAVPASPNAGSSPGPFAEVGPALIRTRS